MSLQDTLDFIAYVAKDTCNGRACFVLECGGGQAQNVITSIGQAFELRFKEYLKKTPQPQGGAAVAAPVANFLTCSSGNISHHNNTTVSTTTTASTTNNTTPSQPAIQYTTVVKDNDRLAL